MMTSRIPVNFIVASNAILRFVVHSTSPYLNAVLKLIDLVLIFSVFTSAMCVTEMYIFFTFSLVHASLSYTGQCEGCC